LRFPKRWNIVQSRIGHSRIGQKDIVLFPFFLLFALAITACEGQKAVSAASETAWKESAHADAEAGAFTNWDDKDPPEIPANCAKCHSTPGYRDFLGLDGATAGQVDKAVPTGTTVECDACHNEVSLEKDSAIMPSNEELTGLGRNSDCLECHQGRASMVQVVETLTDLPPDDVNNDISGPGVHNSPVGPTEYGTLALGGYEYEGKSYSGQYGHVVEFDTCIECHDQHALLIDPERCSACHLGVETAADFRQIRSTNVDYDGDGDISEGLASEIATLEDKLWLAIEVYIASADDLDELVVTRRFVDGNGDSYSTWTPRLLRAAFNYQFSALGKGGYVHNPQYIIQLLYDSIEDIGGSLSGLNRPELAP
jgi:hypothetical protein